MHVLCNLNFLFIVTKFWLLACRGCNMSSIQQLIGSEPAGWIWSINRIQDFRNHKRNKNHFYIIQIFRKSKWTRSDININKMLWNNDMVHKIFDLIDRPNLIKWFSLDQWSTQPVVKSSSYYIYPPSKKPKCCNYVKEIEIS